MRQGWQIREINRKKKKQREKAGREEKETGKT